MKLSYFTHLHFDPQTLQCYGCGKLLPDIQRALRWKGNVPEPVCAQAENLSVVSFSALKTIANSAER